MKRFHRFSRARTHLTRVLGAVATVSAVACGNLTVGGFGEAEVLVSGNAPDPSAVLAAPVASAPVASPARTEHDDEPEGEVEVEFLPSLLALDGRQVSLSPNPIRVRVDLEGRQEADVARETVPATLYTGLQIVFTEIEAEVEAGLVINGVPFVGAVEVELEDLSLSVTREVGLRVEEGGLVQLVVDLNAADWLAAVDPVAGTVDEQVFAAMVSVQVR